MARLTKNRIDNLSFISDKKILWDDNPQGLGVRVSSKSIKTFFIKYRNQYGQQRKLSIGKYGVLTLEQARKLAKEHLVAIAKGNDPSKEKSKIKSSPTMKNLLERYLEEHSKINNKPRTHKGNESYVNRYLIPRLGKYKVQEITRADIYDLQQKLQKRSKIIANNAISILSKAFNLAEVWGWRDDYTNPCRHIKKFPMQSRQRFLTKDEFSILHKKLNFYEKAQLESPSVITAIKLLIHTGCRLSEILTLKWEYIDFDNKCFRLPDSKTGAKTIHFSNEVDNIIKSTKRQPDNPYLISGEKKGQHLNNLQKPWRRIRKDCDIEDVRIHDLRHSFASMAAASGMSLPLIGAMLGHSQPQTTAQYIHLMGKPMHEAANAVSDKINEVMEG